MTTDLSMDRRLSSVFGVDPSPAVLEALDGRVAASIERIRAETPTLLATARHRRRRRRAIAAAAVAAVVVGAATSPPARQAFDSWFGGDFESVWDVATPIGQSVVDQGYRVTLARAYADPVGLYLATTLEDLEGRDVDEAHAAMATVTDDRGVEYPGFLGSMEGSASSTYAEGLWRYRVPPEATAPGVRHVTAAVASISVRANEPPDATDGFDYASLWSEVPGTWTFEFDLVFAGQHEARPNVIASAGGIDMRWTDLVVTPAATVITLEVTGLDPTKKDWGWSYGARIERDGDRLDWFTGQGILDAGPGPQTLVFEMEQGRDDLSGTWTITFDEFQTDLPDPDGDVTTEQRVIKGPWVLTYEGPSAP